MNRGNKTVLNSFDRAAANGHDDGFLMRRGFTVLWVGWEFDAADGTTRIDVPLRLYGTHCRVRGAVTPNADAPTAAFGDVARYAPTDPTAANVSLSVRDGLLGKPTPIARDRFTLEGNQVALKGGFTAGVLTSSSTKSRALRSPVSGSRPCATRSLGLGPRRTRT